MKEANWRSSSVSWIQGHIPLRDASLDVALPPWVKGVKTVTKASDGKKAKPRYTPAKRLLHIAIDRLDDGEFFLIETK